jgi:hypothetical protein
MMLERLHTDCGGQMRLPGAGSTHQYDVVRRVDEFAQVELPHQRLVGVTATEVEAAHVAIRREARGLHLVRKRTHFAFCKLSLEQSTKHGRGSLVGGRVLICELAQCLRHTVQLE